MAQDDPNVGGPYVLKLVFELEKAGATLADAQQYQDDTLMVLGLQRVQAQISTDFLRFYIKSISNPVVQLALNRYRYYPKLWMGGDLKGGPQRVLANSLQAIQDDLAAGANQRILADGWTIVKEYSKDFLGRGRGNG